MKFILASLACAVAPVAALVGGGEDGGMDPMMMMMMMGGMGGEGGEAGGMDQQAMLPFMLQQDIPSYFSDGGLFGGDNIMMIMMAQQQAAQQQAEYERAKRPIQSTWQGCPQTNTCRLQRGGEVEEYVTCLQNQGYESDAFDQGSCKAHLKDLIDQKQARESGQPYYPPGYGVAAGGVAAGSISACPKHTCATSETMSKDEVPGFMGCLEAAGFTADQFSKDCKNQIKAIMEGKVSAAPVGMGAPMGAGYPPMGAPMGAGYPPMGAPMGAGYPPMGAPLGARYPAGAPVVTGAPLAAAGPVPRAAAAPYAHRGPFGAPQAGGAIRQPYYGARVAGAAPRISGGRVGGAALGGAYLGGARLTAPQYQAPSAGR